MLCQETQVFFVFFWNSRALFPSASLQCTHLSIPGYISGWLISNISICNLAKSPIYHLVLLESSINLKLLLITLHYLRHGATFAFETAQRTKFRFHSPCPRDHDPLAAYRYTRWLRKLFERFAIKIRISSSKALKKIAQLLLRDYTFYFYFYYFFIYIYIYKKLFLDENVDKIVEI